MQITPLKLPGTFEITLKPFSDPRGYFVETYREQVFAAEGLITNWVQENQSLSKDKGVVRGLHFQEPPVAQAKLVRAVQGVVWDVWVDLRTESLTYGMWQAIELDAERFNMVYIPHGFAHGFCTLTTDALVAYKVDDYYSREHDTGIHWASPALGIDWPVSEPLLSDKDRNLPNFADFTSPF